MIWLALFFILCVRVSVTVLAGDDNSLATYAAFP